MIHGDSQPSEFGNLLFLAIAAGIGLWHCGHHFGMEFDDQRVVGFLLVV
jgi:hypothetical protein